MVVFKREKRELTHSQQGASAVGVLGSAVVGDDARDESRDGGDHGEADLNHFG